ncbi:hypothetical protein [Duganella qianjiadongensis]|uniref:Sel1 repeat family protein n=1 Tax=Duganella qianjiadongensis TaxID=2692176 RepID=A0ABW9VMP3_9BURK|nr:hypothetical protein [Duganella qianjiadongensis]MYM39698.1 hypothetical protein [Duganella qianjiadongensis]
MELFNKSGVLISSLLVLVGALIACQAKEDAIPPSTVIEAAAMQLGTQGHRAAERRLQEWADLGSPVAQRELALRYVSIPSKRNEARQLFERAAGAGDAQAVINLAGLYQTSALPSSSSAIAGGRALKEVSNASYLPH